MLAVSGSRSWVAVVMPADPASDEVPAMIAATSPSITHRQDIAGAQGAQANQIGAEHGDHRGAS